MPMFEFINLPFTIFIQRIVRRMQFSFGSGRDFQAHRANDHPAFIHRRAGSITINEHRTQRISCFIHVYAKKTSSSRDTDATYATLFSLLFSMQIFSGCTRTAEWNAIMAVWTEPYCMFSLYFVALMEFQSYLLFCSYANWSFEQPKLIRIQSSIRMETNLKFPMETYSRVQFIAESVKMRQIDWSLCHRSPTWLAFAHFLSIHTTPSNSCAPQNWL